MRLQLAPLGMKCVHVRSLVGEWPNFDVIVSFSSVEHDGLGRCKHFVVALKFRHRDWLTDNDPVNPFGDVDASRELFDWMAPGTCHQAVLESYFVVVCAGGHLLLGIPYDQKEGRMKTFAYC